MNSRIYTKLLSAGALLLGAGTLAPACLNRPIEEVRPRRTSVYNETLDNGKVDKIDILISVDDSGSMADKQAILALAVPELIKSLVNPACLPNDSDSGAEPIVVAGPTDECPDGFQREFDPVLDIHVGVIGSSLGMGETGYQLVGGDVTPCVDRKAHLITDAPGGGTVATYDGRGYLAWDPEGQQSPPGEANLDTFIDNVTQLVVGVDQQGCGYEASLESWYRFLVDPEPADKFVIEDDKAVPDGLDNELLAQRDGFLRPDSLVAIVMLTDENDCSVKPGYGYLTGRAGTGGELGMAALVPRSICDTEPNSECCAPCQQSVPESCGTDPICADASLGEQHGHNGLYCWEQKRRFGIDLLQSTDRYVKGLTELEVPDRDGNPVANPLFVSADGQRRPRDRVFLAGIVGVPFQNIARNPEDLGEGLMTSKELTQFEVWTDVLGSPKDYVMPRDEHMVESQAYRDGLATPSSGDWDPIHGHEHDGTYSVAGDLQYACIFDLPEDFQQDCSANNSCDCNTPEGNPLCLQDDGTYGQTQVRAKAYPGLRHLEVLQGMDQQGIVGSICAKQLDDPNAPDFGYQPAIGALVDRLAEKLGPPCLPRRLQPNELGQVACLVLEGKASAGGTCDCSGEAREPVSANEQAAVNVARKNEDAAGLDCFCKVTQLENEALDACRTQVEDEVTVGNDPVHGWCYIDDRYGDEALLQSCGDGIERQLIRMVGEGQPAVGAKHFITCAYEG